MIFIWEGLGGSDKSAALDGLNWVDQYGTRYATGRYPGSEPGDEMVFDTQLGQNAEAPAGFDGTSLNPITRVTIGSNCNYDIASSASYAKIPFMEMFCNAPNCTAYIERLNLVSMVASNAPKNVFVYNSASLSLQGEIENLSALRGGVTVKDGATVTGLLAGFVEDVEADLSLTIEKNVTLDGDIQQTGGMVTCHSDLVDIKQANGTWTHYGQVTGVIYADDGLFNWVNGDVDRAVIRSGEVTGAQGATPRHIRTASISSTGLLNMQNGLGNVRVLETIELEGGDLKGPIGSSLKMAPVIETVPGIANGVEVLAASGNSTTAWFKVERYDKILLIISRETANIGFTARAAMDNTGSGFVSITPEVDSDFYRLGDIQLNQDVYSFWGKDLPNGHPWVAITMLNGDGANPRAAGLFILRERY